MKKLYLFLLTATMSISTMAHNPLTDRSMFNFHWGFNNWGAGMLDGLSGMSDNAYSLRTSFSSYQLSYGMKWYVNNTITAAIGVGYESDVYKFDTPYVSYSETLHSFYDMPSTGKMKTKLCTRYITLPITLDLEIYDDFTIRLSAIPGLNYTGKNTGLKNKSDNGLDQMQVGDLNPYKLDARVEFIYGGIGLFLQVSTLPLMKDSFARELYPIKFGIVL